MKCWKVYCMEGDYPGLWRRWLREQCVAVGWCAKWNYPLNGHTSSRAWARTRTMLKEIAVGDFIVVHLQGNRVGRIGEVVRKEIDDGQWEPTVPPTKEEPDGEQGRRVLVRWTGEGPLDPELVVQLDEGTGFDGWLARAPISRLEVEQFNAIRAVVADDTNWCRYSAGFSYERSLSDYVASYPHRLEDGLQPYPNAKLREHVFVDGSRADVLLMDSKGNPVVVECKQGTATAANIKQLRGYMKRVAEQTSKPVVRGILVHGGARRLADDVVAEANEEPKVVVLRYRVDVDFDPCST